MKFHSGYFTEATNTNTELVANETKIIHKDKFHNILDQLHDP